MSSFMSTQPCNTRVSCATACVRKLAREDAEQGTYHTKILKVIKVDRSRRAVATQEIQSSS